MSSTNDVGDLEKLKKVNNGLNMRKRYQFWKVTSNPGVWLWFTILLSPVWIWNRINRLLGYLLRVLRCSDQKVIQKLWRMGKSQKSSVMWEFVRHRQRNKSHKNWKTSDFKSVKSQYYVSQKYFPFSLLWNKDEWGRKRIWRKIYTNTSSACFGGFPNDCGFFLLRQTNVPWHPGNFFCLPHGSAVRQINWWLKLMAS